jgi:hypothetical protein
MQDFDLVVVGAGAAELTAALIAVLLVERKSWMPGIRPGMTRFFAHANKKQVSARRQPCRRSIAKSSAA